ncbi:MAG: hypothetical protein J7M01_03820 [Candidatus Marinimicrobia bacterium]|nr:hypothetical protein [Candidatus Neomarinimicrobiota bacterium]
MLNQKSYFKKWILIAIVVLGVAVSWIGSIDSQAEEYVDEAIIQSTVAYGSARALNAAVSVAQSAQLGFSAGGEASFHPLEILDPVNDMVEDYATAMKYSISSLIIQKLLVEILANNLFKWLMLGVGILLIMSLLFLNGVYVFLFFKGFAFIALIRFMLVATVLLSSYMDGTFLNEQTDAHIDTVDKATKAIGLTNEINEALPTEDRIAIKQQIHKIESQQEKQDERIQSYKYVVLKAKDIMQADQDKLDEINGQKGIIERVFSDDPEADVAKEILEKSKEAYGSALDEQEDLIGELENLQSTHSDLQESLQGEKGLISDIKRKISAARTLFDSQKIKQVLKDSIQAMLHLIALFIFKTLIMPIVFLLLILRSFKWIWGIDTRHLVKDSFDGRKN